MNWVISDYNLSRMDERLKKVKSTYFSQIINFDNTSLVRK
jgi:hypothetical protein